MNAKLLHQKALEASKSYFIAEAELLAILQEIDAGRVYRELGHTSLFNYAVQALGLSESTAYNFITVARKSREVPALMAEIRKGKLSVSKARKVAPVLTRENQTEWIGKAQELSQKALEKEVARVAPREAVPERATYVSETHMKLTLGISEKLHLKLKRIVDLESQRARHAAKLEEALESMADLYLEKYDPLEKAKRARPKKVDLVTETGVSLGKPVARQAPNTKRVAGARTSLPAETRHAVNLRDQNRCTQKDNLGLRCSETRWLDIHHIRPISRGGDNELENLTTVCAAHHRMAHAEQGVNGEPKAHANP